MKCIDDIRLEQFLQRRKRFAALKARDFRDVVTPLCVIDFSQSSSCPQPVFSCK